MKSFPIMLDMRGRRAVVVGAGPVGLRKVRALREAAAEVTLVDPAARAAPEGVRVIRRPYQARQLRGAVLVFACADDARLNARIAADARRAGALVNVADQPGDCDFHLPAVARDGDVVLAVGTGGLAAALAARLRDRLAGAMPARAGRFAQALSALREQLKHDVPNGATRMRIARRLSSQQGYNVFVRQGRTGLRRMLKRLVKDASDADSVRGTQP
jgi:siroheme synthase-like protein